MNHRLGIRLTSLALSIVVTFALFSGIETLAEGLHAGAGSAGALQPGGQRLG